VTPINTGNARRRPARRGASTFVPWQVFLRTKWASVDLTIQARYPTFGSTYAIGAHHDAARTPDTPR
jgi:hypothetical protein